MRFGAEEGEIIDGRLIQPGSPTLGSTGMSGQRVTAGHTRKRTSWCSHQEEEVLACEVRSQPVASYGTDPRRSRCPARGL